MSCSNQVAIAVSLAYCLFLLLAGSDGSNSTKILFLKNVCRRERVTFPVNYEGCEPTTTNVYVCNGACSSDVTMTRDPPYFSSSCVNCCEPTTFRTKVRRILFNCNGTETVKKLYFPVPMSCGQVNNALN